MASNKGSKTKQQSASSSNEPSSTSGDDSGNNGNVSNSKYQIQRGLEIALDAIDPNPWNPNRTSERQQKAIGESLNWVGQVLDILVRPHPEDEGRYQVIDGEHRLIELQKAGVGTAFVNCIQGLSDADAKKLTIVTNETRGNADRIELASLLADIADSYSTEGLDEMVGIGLPYEAKELDELIKLAAVDWDSFNEDDSESDGDGSGQQGEQNGSGGDSDGGEGEDEDLKPLFAKLTPEAFEALEDAYKLVQEKKRQEGEPLPKDRAIAWGIALEEIANEYRGGL